MELKMALFTLYENQKTIWKNTTATISSEFLQRLSPPLLLSIKDGWLASKKKILIIGQETLGWAFQSGEYYPWSNDPIISFPDFLNVSNSVQLLQNGYEYFDFSKYQPENYGSPFWQTYRIMREKLENDIEWSILWSNLFRFSIDRGSVIENCTADELNVVRNLNGNILKEEIATIQPHCVVFFTGPNYDFELEKCFEDLRYIQFKEYPIREIAQLEHSGLPPKCFRTYHPKYLFLKKWDLFEDMLSLL